MDECKQSSHPPDFLDRLFLVVGGTGQRFVVTIVCTPSSSQNQLSVKLLGSTTLLVDSFGHGIAGRFADLPSAWAGCKSPVEAKERVSLLLLGRAALEFIGQRFAVGSVVVVGGNQRG